MNGRGRTVALMRMTCRPDKSGYPNAVVRRRKGPDGPGIGPVAAAPHEVVGPSRPPSCSSRKPRAWRVVVDDSRSDSRHGEARAGDRRSDRGEMTSGRAASGDDETRITDARLGHAEAFRERQELAFPDDRRTTGGLLTQRFKQMKLLGNGGSIGSRLLDDGIGVLVDRWLVRPKEGLCLALRPWGVGLASRRTGDGCPPANRRRDDRPGSVSAGDRRLVYGGGSTWDSSVPPGGAACWWEPRSVRPNGRRGPEERDIHRDRRGGIEDRGVSVSSDESRRRGAASSFDEGLGTPRPAWRWGRVARLDRAVARRAETALRRSPDLRSQDP